MLFACCVDYEDGQSSASIQIRREIVFDTTELFGVSDLTSILWLVQQPDGNPGPVEDRRSRFFSYVPTQGGIHRIDVTAATPSSRIAHTVLLYVQD